MVTNYSETHRMKHFTQLIFIIYRVYTTVSSGIVLDSSIHDLVTYFDTVFVLWAQSWNISYIAYVCSIGNRQKPSEATVFQLFPLASRRDSTVNFNITFLFKKQFFLEVIKTKVTAISTESYAS